MMASQNLSTDSLFNLFTATMSSDQNIRQQAETSLNSMSTAPGILPALLEQISNPQADPSLSLAMAIFVKNQVERKWLVDFDDEEVSTDSPGEISEADRVMVKQLIIKALLFGFSANPKLVPVLKAVVHRLVRLDFPKKWPELPELIAPLLTCEQSLKCGLLVLHEVFAWKGYDDDEVMKALLSRFCPLLLHIGQSALTQGNFEVLKAVLKSVHSCIAYKYSDHVLGPNTVIPFLTLITQTLQITDPAGLNSQDMDEVSELPLLKAKKWAMHLQIRVIKRHACKDGTNFVAPKSEHRDWSLPQFYMTNLAGPILQVILQIAFSGFLTDRMYVLVLDYFGEVVRSKDLFMSGLLPNLEKILTDLVFPKLASSEKDIELLQDDPVAYVKEALHDPFMDYYSPSAQSSAFVVDLCKQRRKHVFPVVLSLISNKIQTHDLKSKEGAIVLVGSLSRLLLKHDFSRQVEMLFNAFLCPIIKSQSGVLKIKALWCLQQFSELKFEDKQLERTLCELVLISLNTSVSLPERVQAADCLSEFIDNEQMQVILPQCITDSVKVILQLNQECQVDSLPNTLERIVSMFTESVKPFACELCSSLVQTAYGILASAPCPDNSNDEFDEKGFEKMMAAMGMMRTVGTLVDAVEDAQLLLELEQIILPLLSFAFQNNHEDVYEEAFDLIETVTFCQKRVTMPMWQLVSAIADKPDMEDWDDEIARVIDNLVTFDPLGFVRCTSVCNRALGIAHRFEDPVSCCAMIESIVLACREAIDIIKPLLMLVNKRIVEELVDTDSLTILHLNVLLAGWHAHPVIMASFVDSNAFIAKLSLLSTKFKRVHDKRLVICGLAGMLGVNYTRLSNDQLSHALQVFAEAIGTLPKAMADRKKLQEAEENDDGLELSDGDYDDLDAVEDMNGRDEGNLDSQSSDFDFEDDGYESDGELEEELYFESPLDAVDVACVAQSSLRSLAQSNPANVNQALMSVKEAERNLLLSIIQ